MCSTANPMGKCSEELLAIVPLSPIQTRTFHRWLIIHPHTLKRGHVVATLRSSSVLLTCVKTMQCVTKHDFPLGL